MNLVHANMDLTGRSATPKSRMLRVLDCVCKVTTKGKIPKNDGFPYLLLPPEIRNIIMRLVLVPGNIHVCVAKPRQVKNAGRILGPIHSLMAEFSLAKHISRYGSGDCPLRKPGFQLLATCNQVRSEGTEFFYSMNTFSIPPGFAEYSHDYLFDSLSRKHRCMISSVGIQLGLEDLIPSVFSEIRENVEWVERVNHGGHHELSGRMLARFWGLAVELKLSDIWKAKLALLKNLGDLSSVKLVTIRKELVVPACEITAVRRGRGTGTGSKRYSPEVEAILRHSRKIVRRTVARKVNQDGWKSLREWVTGGCKA